MTEHIEWSLAREAKPKLADPAWVQTHIDDIHGSRNWALLLDTGSSTIAVEGTPAELAELGREIVEITKQDGASPALPMPAISHPAIGATPQPNFTRVTIGTLTLWFSYETCIAFNTGAELVVTRNRWSTTTGKHLNWLDAGDPFKRRLDQADFEAALSTTLAGGVA